MQRVLERGAGYGGSEAGIAALLVNKQQLFVCSYCSCLVQLIVACRGGGDIPARRGCSSYMCLSNKKQYQPGRFWATQQRRVQGLIDGTMYLVGKPDSVTDEFRHYPGVFTVTEAIVDVMIMSEYPV